MVKAFSCIIFGLLVGIVAAILAQGRHPYGETSGAVQGPNVHYGPRAQDMEHKRIGIMLCELKGKAVEDHETSNRIKWQCLVENGLAH